MIEKTPKIEKPETSPTLSSIVEELLTLEKNKDQTPLNSPREYRIEGEVDQDDLERLCELPYEISLIEIDGKFILSTGYSHGTIPVDDKEDSETFDFYIDRQEKSRIDFHTHPNHAGSLALMPSAGDLIALASRSYFENKDIPMIIANREGLIFIRNIEPQRYRQILNFFYTERRRMYESQEEINQDNFDEEIELQIVEEVLKKFPFQLKKISWKDREDIKKVLDENLILK